MEWWVVLVIISGLLVALFLSGLPVAFAFLFINFIGVLIWMGGVNSLQLVIASVVRNIGVFSLVAVPLFIFMGEILFQTGVVKLMTDALGMWIGRIHGSLSLVAVASGTIFAMMSGSSISGVAILGSTLVPDMRSKGYSKEMSLGPILGAGGLAIIIPPSILIVILGVLAHVSISKLLIAGVVPGFILAGLYVAYILIRARLQPHLAPLFAPPKVTWIQRIKALAFISPISIIIFMVLGLIFLGVATPSEAAATGVMGALIVAGAYRKVTLHTLKKSVSETLMVTSMVFMIIMGSLTFSNVLVFSGATPGLVGLIEKLTIHPIMIVIAMQVTLIILGMFIDSISIMMITVPIYFPIIQSLGFDPIWFGILMLVNMEMGCISPPFGLFNFVLKGVVPDATMADIILAGIPFFFLGMASLVVMLIFPQVVTWLPSIMG